MPNTASILSAPPGRKVLRRHPINFIVAFATLIAGLVYDTRHVAIAQELTDLLPLSRATFQLAVHKGVSLTRRDVFLLVDENMASERSISNRIGRSNGTVESLEVNLFRLYGDASAELLLQRDSVSVIQMRARQTIRLGPFKGSLPLDGTLELGRSNLDLFIGLPVDIMKISLSDLAWIRIDPSLHLHRIDFDLRFSDGLQARQDGMYPSIGLRVGFHRAGQLRPLLWLSGKVFKTGEFSYRNLSFGFEWPAFKYERSFIGLRAMLEESSAHFSDINYKVSFKELRPTVGVIAVF